MSTTWCSVSGPGSRVCLCFFFSSRRRHTRSLCDWSSDVCSSDLYGGTCGISVLIAAPAHRMRSASLRNPQGEDLVMAMIFLACERKVAELLARKGDRKSVV